MNGGVGRVLRLAHAVAVVLACGCGSPEAFHKTSDAGFIATGSGGSPFGSGGSTFGSGGSTFNTGGSTFNTGGSTFNTGGSTFNTGGSSAGTGGRGTGGAGTGGAGTGGAGTGGAGTGGAGTGGAGTGGAGTGGSGMGGAGTAGSGAGGRGTGGAGGRGTGGSSGTNPCAGLCSAPVVITMQSYASGNLGTGATCHETTINIQSGNCSNFIAPRTFSINGMTVPLAGNWPTPLPAKKNGGYCFQASAGDPTFAAFVTF